MSHADHMLSAVYRMSPGTDSFALRVLPDIAQTIFYCYEALPGSLADIAIARRHNILSASTGNIYVADCKTAPIADTQMRLPTAIGT